VVHQAHGLERVVLVLLILLLGVVVEDEV